MGDIAKLAFRLKAQIRHFAAGLCVGLTAAASRASSPVSCITVLHKTCPDSRKRSRLTYSDASSICPELSRYDGKNFRLTIRKRAHTPILLGIEKLRGPIQVP